MNITEKLDGLRRAVGYGMANGKRNMIVDIDRLVELFAQNEELRKALRPFAAAAGRPGRLLDSMTDQPLEDTTILALGIRVSAWKEANRLTLLGSGDA